MGSAPVALISRSIQHLLRRHAATASALSLVSSKSLIGRINPTAEVPISGTGTTNIGLSGRSLDMALFGRFDWPAITASEQVNLEAKKSDDEDSSDEDIDEYGYGDFASDEFDEAEFDDSEEDEDEDEEAETKKPVKE